MNTPGNKAEVQHDAAAQMAVAQRHVAAANWAEAAAAFKGVLRVAPERAGAWAGLGSVAYQSGRHLEAERCFQQALRLQPDNPEFHGRLGVVLRSLSRLEDAIRHYERALALDPNQPVMLSNFGNALSAAGHHERAVEVLQSAVNLDPDSPLFRCNLGRALLRSHRRGMEALEQFERSRSLAPGAEVEADCGHALIQLERYEEAVAAYRRAEAMGHRSHQMFHNLGTALQCLGRLDEAVAAYETALAIQPDFAVSRRQLVGARKYERLDDEVSRLEEQLKNSNLNIDQRSELHFALAKMLDDIGAYSDAFPHLQAGNQMIRASIEYSADKNTQYIDALIETFDERFFSDRSSFGLDSDVPLFIVGMPRSGTSLVEQILASHPLVHGAGELTKLNELFAGLRHRLKPDLKMPRIVRLMDKTLAKETGEEYLAYLRGFNPTARYVCDKMPFNYRVLGLIALLFPRARVIHCMREPLDIGLSCYFARFKEELSFSFNQVEIGHYYRDYERLMAHWRTVVRNPVLEVRYETLVAQQEKETHRLLDFCQLPWDEQCLRFHETERPVITASNWQVRQPLYKSAVGRWRNYQPHLGPLMAALGISSDEGRGRTNEYADMTH